MAASTNYLRCALVWEKTVLDEGVFAPASRVTVGDSPRATFTLQTPDLGKRFLLFSHSNNGTVLHLQDGMLGKVRLSGQTREVDQMVGVDAVADRNGSVVRYTLGDGDNGVLVFGRVGLAFSVTSQDGKAPTARVGSILGSDPFTGKIFGVTLALVMLFSLVLRLFAGAASEFSVEQLPERMVSFVVDDPEAAAAFKKELEQMREERIKEQERKEQEQKEAAKEEKKKSAKVTNKRPENGRVVDEETERIRKRVAKKGVAGALSEAKKKKGALGDLLKEGGLDISLNQAVRAMDRGAARARVLGAKGVGGSNFLPGLVARRGAGEGLGEATAEERPATGRTGRAASRASRLRERSEARVTVTMPSNSATTSGGRLSKKAIGDVVKRNRGAIKYCYESQLNRYPTLRGKVVVDFIIDTSGKVQKVKVANSTLSQAKAKNLVHRCLIKFISRWRFPKPQGGKVRVIYPFTFGRRK